MRPVILIFSLVFMVSCFNQGDCLITATNLVKIALKKELDSKDKSTKFFQIQAQTETDTLDFVTGADTTLTLVVLPLDPNRLKTTFVFFTGDTLTYHLTLDYTTYTTLIATDCGAYLYYRDLSVSETDFDRTKIINSQLLKGVPTNLEVFF